ncbi:hypothetical protein BDL97_18G097700 [Sphagnum fallax]|nr:hypothetical protein BDL97_18G097700 [Sphagnum fallax]
MLRGLLQSSIAATRRGMTTASFQSNGDLGTGVFAGNLSVELMEHANTRMRRSGFSGIRTVQDLNLEDFNTIAMRVKGDGRCYVSTIRTENWMGAPGATDPNTWQAFVFAPRDEWSVIKSSTIPFKIRRDFMSFGALQIPLARYLPTWKGKIVESDAEMNAARVTGMGLSLTAEGGPEGGEQGPGPFRLELDWIKALRVT